MSVRLYVGNLPKELERQELESVFSEFDDSISTKVITDRKTGKCRGFGFVTVKSEEQADQVIEKFNGYQLGESVIKIERAQPRAKGKEEEGEQAPQSSGTSNNRRAAALGRPEAQAGKTGDRTGDQELLAVPRSGRL